ncbi:helix-turn-helix domain-containing protein [Megasphaera sp. WILCCON 0056]|uniref:helix-turn-helix domain-containing protein n=1 Tax=Megasphaera sp. WILCCON 0056 TaxID=3345340 RepID=UPI003A7FB9DC
MPFKDNLKKYREKSGYTAKAFAKTINIAYTTYLTYENQGREPKFDTLIKIADALHVSIDELLGYKADMADELTRSIQFLESIGFTIHRYHSSKLEHYQDYFVINSQSFDKSTFPRNIKEFFMISDHRNKNIAHLSRAVIPQTVIDLAHWLLNNETLNQNISALYYQEAFKILPFMGHEIREEIEASYWKNPPAFENKDIPIEEKNKTRRTALLLRYLDIIRGKD